MKDLEACQRQLSDAKDACASGPAKELHKCQAQLEDAGKQGESERRRVLAKDAESLRAQSELEACKRSGARCESDRGKMEEKVEKAKEDEAACRHRIEACKQTAQACKQHSETLQGGTLLMLLPPSPSRVLVPTLAQWHPSCRIEQAWRKQMCLGQRARAHGHTACCDQGTIDFISTVLSSFFRADLSECRKRMAQPSHLELKVGQGQEDILRMDDQEMADEIQRLRRNTDRSHLKTSPGNEDILLMDVDAMVSEIQNLRVGT